MWSEIQGQEATAAAVIGALTPQAHAKQEKTNVTTIVTKNAHKD